MFHVVLQYTLRPQGRDRPCIRRRVYKRRRRDFKQLFKSILWQYQGASATFVPMCHVGNTAMEPLWANSGIAGSNCRVIIFQTLLAHFQGASLTALLCLAPAAHAEMSGGKVKIGVLTDLSGPYEQNSGVGSVEAAKMAAEEVSNKVNGVPVEIVAADHQNKPDIGAAIARRWFDLDGVDAVTDLVNSAVGFAVLEIAKTTTRRCC